MATFCLEEVVVSEAAQDWISWSFSLSNLTRNARLVLLVIACRADKKGFAPRMSDGDLIDLSRADIRLQDLQVVMSELIESNYLSIKTKGYFLKR